MDMNIKKNDWYFHKHHKQYVNRKISISLENHKALTILIKKYQPEEYF